MQKNNEQKHVLMTLYGPLETDARVLRSIDAALRNDCKITIITCRTSASYVPKEGVNIVNLRINPCGLFKFLIFSIYSLVYYLLNCNRINLIYLHDYYSTLPGLWLSYITKTKIVYDAHELIIVESEYKPTLREKFFISVEKQLAKRVDQIIEANDERAEIFSRRYNLSNVISILNISKFNFQSKVKRSVDKNKISLVYQGNITEERNLSFYIRAIRNHPNCYLTLIGAGEAMNKYKSLVREYKLEDRVYFTGRLSNELMMKKLDECSIGIISYPFTNLNNIYCSPNKIFEYAALSLPFIATNQPFILSVQQKYQIGKTFDMDDVDSFIQGVNDIVNNYQDYMKNMPLFLQDYNYDKELSKYNLVFNDSLL